MGFSVCHFKRWVNLIGRTGVLPDLIYILCMCISVADRYTATLWQVITLVCLIISTFSVNYKEGNVH